MEKSKIGKPVRSSLNCSMGDDDNLNYRGSAECKEENGIKRWIFGIDPIGTEDGADEGSKGEKDTENDSQSFGMSKWEERHHAQRRGMLKKKTCRAKAVMGLKGFPLHR